MPITRRMKVDGMDVTAVYADPARFVSITAAADTKRSDDVQLPTDIVRLLAKAGVAPPPKGEMLDRDALDRSLIGLAVGERFAVKQQLAGAGLLRSAASGPLAPSRGSITPSSGLLAAQRRDFQLAHRRAPVVLLELKQQLARLSELALLRQSPVGYPGGVGATSWLGHRDSAPDVCAHDASWWAGRQITSVGTRTEDYAGGGGALRSFSIPGSENAYVRNISVKACKDLASASLNGSSSCEASLPRSRISCAHPSLLAMPSVSGKLSIRL